MTKECSGFTGGAGSFCTITSSNLKAIEVGSRILYLQPDQLFTPVGSDVVLDLPGPGNNTAFGHCSLAARSVHVLGRDREVHRVPCHVSMSRRRLLRTEDWHWEGTYSFSPQD